jgi:hypothetical protein
MGLRSLVQWAVVLAMLAVSTGRLPAVLKAVKVAQLQLIQDSKASKWERALLLPSH